MEVIKIFCALVFLTCSLFGKGSLSKHHFSDSKIYPGTHRDYWIYVPKEYEQAKQKQPICLMVFQDGAAYLRNPGKVGYVPDILDELISAGEIPVTIGLFINPGVVPASHENTNPRLNRSFEYDGMGPSYANFLIDEILPLLEEKGLDISKNPDDRAICGSTSGAVAAFTAAWERPDCFRRVYSMNGSYVGLRGGNNYPTLIRQTEPKPLRVFLQEEPNDFNNLAGDLRLANQSMQQALEWSGYEHRYGRNEGADGREGGNQFMPEALRWLWQGHGKLAVQTHLENCQSQASKYLIPGEGWKVVSEGHNWSEGLALAQDGTLYFTDVYDQELFKITPDGKESLIAKETARANGIALGPKGEFLYTASSKQIRRYDLATGKHKVIAKGHGANDIVVSHSGHLYFTDPKAGKVWYVDLKTQQQREVARLKDANGIGMSADQALLFVCESNKPFIHSYFIQVEGSLINGQPYFYAQKATGTGRYALDGQCSTSSGLLLVGTAAGLQILDHHGRVQLVLPRPAYEDGRVNYCALYENTLYIATRHRIYNRKVKLIEAPAWKAPVKMKNHSFIE